MSDRINDLANAFVAGTLDEQELDELERLLAEDPVARDAFVEYSTLHTDLFFTMRANRLTSNLVGALKRSKTDNPTPTAVPTSDAVDRSFPSARAWRWQAFMVALACSLLVAVWGVTRPEREPSATGVDFVQTKVDAVATLYETSGLVWKDANDSLLPGSPLPVGKRLRFRSGLAELVFRSGAQVLVEGPADLKLVSDMELSLVTGRLTAKVPSDAIGFSVRTDSTRVMDLGTEFGVVAGPNRESEVVVFEGEVIVSQRDGSGQNHRLSAGRMVRSTEDGISESNLTAELKPFVRTIDRDVFTDQGETVANFRRDFRPAAPNQEFQHSNWRYLWNGLGPQGNPEHYLPLKWNGSSFYDTNGTGAYPAGDPAYSLQLREVGGHPGRDASTSDVHDFGHGPVAAFAVPASGYYAVADSWLARFDGRQKDEVSEDNEFGLDVMIHVNANEPVLQRTAYDVEKTTFDVALGYLKAGDVIYVAIGPNYSSRYDTFHWNFSIVRNETPMTSASSDPSSRSSDSTQLSVSKPFFVRSTSHLSLRPNHFRFTHN